MDGRTSFAEMHRLTVVINQFTDSRKAKGESMKNLKFMYEEKYGGGDGRVIDRHVTRVYEDENGVEYHLDRDNSIIPPCFEALGPIPKGFQGITPIIKIDGERYFGDGISWKKATEIFLGAVNNIEGRE